MSKSSAVSVLIFKKQETNGALFFKVNYLPYASLSGSVTVIFSFTTMYASLKSHKSHISIGVLNLFCLFGLCLSSALLD